MKTSQKSLCILTILIAPSTRSPVCKSVIGWGFVKAMAYCKSRSLSPLKLKLWFVVWTTAPSMSTALGRTPTRLGEKFLAKSSEGKYYDRQSANPKKRSRSPSRKDWGVNSTRNFNWRIRFVIAMSDLTNSISILRCCDWLVVNSIQGSQAIGGDELIAVL